GDAGAQRLERRLDEAAKALERQRDDWMSLFDSRIVGLEADVRRRVEELTSDAEAERAVLEARLQELARRVEATAGVRGASCATPPRQQTEVRGRPMEPERTRPGKETDM